VGVLLSVGLAVAGIVAGLLGGWYFFRRGGAARTKVVIGLEERSRIDPETLGIGVRMKVGVSEVTNILIFELTVANHGPADIEEADPEDESRQYLRPRLEFPDGVRALTSPWTPGGRTGSADVRVARQLVDDQQHFHIHIHRLKVGGVAQIRIIATYRSEASAPEIDADGFGFYPGFAVNRDVRPTGLLKTPARQLPQ